MTKKKQKEAKPGWEVALLLLVGALAFSRGKNSGEGQDAGQGASRPVNDAMLQSAFQKVKSIFGAKIAGETEQLYRKETRHFDSGQFKKTYTPGMEQAKGADLFPFGWGSLNKFLEAYPQYAGNFTLVSMIENNTEIVKKYVSFPTLEGAVMFVAYTIKNRGFAGYWRSFDEATAQRYYNSLIEYPIKYT